MMIHMLINFKASYQLLIASHMQSELSHLIQCSVAWKSPTDAALPLDHQLLNCLWPLLDHELTFESFGSKRTLKEGTLNSSVRFLDKYVL